MDASQSGSIGKASCQMVTNSVNEKTTKLGRVNRAIFSCLGLGVISAAVAVLGAPTKWGF